MEKDVVATKYEISKQQQQLQARLQQEEVERRRLEEAEKSRVPYAAKIDPQAPWFYSDPQQNIQVCANGVTTNSRMTIINPLNVVRPQGSFPWR